MNREMRRKIGKIDTLKLETKITKEINKALGRCTCPLEEADTITYSHGYIDCLYNLHMVSEKFVNDFLTRFQFDLTESLNYGKVNFNEEIDN